MHGPGQVITEADQAPQCSSRPGIDGYSEFCEPMRYRDKGVRLFLRADRIIISKVMFFDKRPLS